MILDSSVTDNQSIRAFNKLPSIYLTRHKNFYDYSKFVFYGVNIKTTIICPVHGEFLQSPKEHRNYGCRLCGINQSSRLKTKTTKDFIQRSINTHGDKYDYSKTEYIDCNTRLLIICKEHGEFYQMPYHHIKGSGCQKCAEHSRIKKFIDKPTTLYYVRITIGSKVLYKIGITISSIRKRFRCEIKRGAIVETIHQINFDTGEFAFKLEQYILEKFYHKKYKGEQFLYRGFGDSELFIEDISNELTCFNN